MLRTAFVDDQLYAKEFNSGDFVRKSTIRDHVMAPYVGRVLYSDTETGKVSVQWPWGVESETATELVRDTSNYYSPPLDIDQSYSTWEKARWTSSPEIVKADEKWRKGLASQIVAEFEKSTLPIWREACALLHRGISEMDAYVHLSSDFSSEFGDDTVRRTVSNLYEDGRRLAIYWKDSNRRYRVTQNEKTSGKIICPRCKGELKKRVYRQGRTILQCKGCGFSIHPRDLKV